MCMHVYNIYLFFTYVTYFLATRKVFTENMAWILLFYCVDEEYKIIWLFISISLFVLGIGVLWIQ